MRGCLWIAVLIFLVGGCGRYFPQPLRPTPQQAEGMTVNDDGSVTYALERLAITLRPMTDAELNRQFPQASTGGAAAVNPYTFGDWAPPGDDWTPSRFLVMKLGVANYQFPKVLIDPFKATIKAANNQIYRALSYAELYEYYRAYWQANSGQGRIEFRARTDILKQTMFTDAFIFSGRDEEGYIVFPRLDDEIQRIQVEIADIAIRFNFDNEPVETIDLSVSFEREVLKGNAPHSAVPLN